MFIDSLLPSKKKNSAKLVEKSEGIANVFVATKNALLSVNDDMDAETVAIQLRVNDLQTEQTLMNNSMERNSKMVAKINSFLDID